MKSEIEKFPTPGVVTIEGLTQPPCNVSAERQIKTLVYLVGSKVVFPEVEAEDSDGCAFLGEIILLREHAADSGADAENVEVISADHFGVGNLRMIVVGHSCLRLIGRDQAVERLTLVAQIDQYW